MDALRLYGAYIAASILLNIKVGAMEVLKARHRGAERAGPHVRLLEVAAGRTGRTLVLFHGLGVTAEQWRTGSCAGFVAARAAAGDRVMILAVSQLAPAHLADGSLLRAVQDLVSDLDGDVIPIGISFGAWIAMNTAISCGTSSYAGLCPVVKASSLREFWWLRGTRLDGSELATKRGFLSFGGRDWRAPTRHARRLAIETGARTIEFPLRTHDVGRDELDLLSDWLDEDPNRPPSSARAAAARRC